MCECVLMGFALSLTDKPRAGSGLSNVTASIGQDVTLTCTTDANPTPTPHPRGSEDSSVVRAPD